MSSKIIQAVNSMIGNSDKITDVISMGDEYFFKFKGYIWSIYIDGEEFYLNYYPKVDIIDELIKSENPRNYYSYVEYNTLDMKTREAVETFSNLHLIIKEKIYDVDKVLDDIIGSDLFWHYKLIR